MLKTEHPNPQFVRENWINLNGEWDFEIDNAKTGEARGLHNQTSLSQKINVPFCPESKLSGIRNTDFMYCVWYKKILTLPKDWQNSRVFLNIGACDYHTTVFVNGKNVCEHFGGYTPIKADITDCLLDKDNDITIRAFDNPQDRKIPSGKQCPLYKSFGCFYTRTTGIWQTVWLEKVPETYIKSVKITPSLKNGEVHLLADVSENADGKIFKAEVKFGGETVAKGESTVVFRQAQLSLKLNKIYQWDLNTPNLYDIIFTLDNDEVKSYFGLRDVSFKNGKFYLNEKPVFQRLILDQGYFPDGVYTALSDEDLINDILLAKKMGFNGARMHQKVFEPRYIYHADRLGYLTWGEHASWSINEDGDSIYEAFANEWLEILERDYNHPSIIGWCPLNETGRNVNQRFVRFLHKLTMDYDRTRMFIDNSGYYHITGTYDIYDVHDYTCDVEKFKNAYLPLIEGKPARHFAGRNGGVPVHEDRNDITFISEFGGMSLLNGEDSWGYEKFNDVDSFVNCYKGLVDSMLDNPKISGFCYTQLTDVEQEQNGLYTYQREPKLNPEIIYKINTRTAKCEEE